ncbi:MAG: DUF2326 domain-containing protein [Leptospiraceae bacterium]|nr:DUF2326 domain-containing protein [Leptospiraceae bacterium]
MQLLKVYSNKSSFRTVEFNLNKPNFIVAIQKNPGSSENGKTYNGVGKTLLVRIIHFCLGASVEDYKVFCEKLKDWEFYIDFKIKNQLYTAKRKTNEPEKIILNNEDLNLDKFNKKLAKLCFSIPENILFLSFRSLFPFFIRPKKESYVDCQKPGKSVSEYQTMLYNSFLIGLDVHLAEKKYKLRQEQERIRKLEKNFKEDSLLREFFMGNRDVALTLADLDEKIKKIEMDLKKYQVADNFYEIQKEADLVEKSLFEINNEITIIKNNIDNLEKSLNLTPSKSNTNLETLYSEVNLLFTDSVKKTLDEINEFYNKLLSNRIRRLVEQKNQFQVLLTEKNNKSLLLRKRLDDLLKFLGEHQALDLFISLSQKVSDLKSEKDNLEKYQVLQSEYKSKDRQTGKEMIELSEITDNYLVEIDKATKPIKNYFRKLVKSFYPNSIAGLTIKTNEGENQLIFNIDPKIESDASDGIGNVKLFCYDLSILNEGKNHNVEFLFHDSRLYDGVDERQKIIMFKIISETFSNSSKQYISTINQNQLTEIKTSLSDSEYKNFIENNIILILTDDADVDKLLGIKVDLR